MHKVAYLEVCSNDDKVRHLHGQIQIQIGVAHYRLSKCLSDIY
jgi:hypothetical protein